MQQRFAALVESGLTRRDLILGALLVLQDRQALDPLSQPRSDPAARAAATTIATVLSAAVVQAGAEATDCFGLPPWLCGALGDGQGLAGLLGRLVDEHEDSGWRQLGDLLRADRLDGAVWDLFERLQDWPRSPPLEELRRLRGNVVNLHGDLSPRPLAAAGSLTFRQQKLLAEAASGSHGNPLRSELGWRLRRMDIPLVGWGDEELPRGVVIGAEVKFTSAAEVVVSIPNEPAIRKLVSDSPNGKRTWRVADPSFEKGLRLGLAAARALLTTLGCSDDELVRVAGAEVRLRGLLPPSKVEDASAGLPLALRALAEVSDLPLPEVAASGSFNDSYRLESMDPALVDAKRAAVEGDGLNTMGLLVRSPESASREGLILVAEDSLAAAAAALWGSSWENWERTRREAALDSWNLKVGWSSGIRPGALKLEGEIVVVPTGRAEEIWSFFGSNPPCPAFLGGPRQSGKTWIAQEVADFAAGNPNWGLLILTPLRDRVPSADDLLQAIRLAAPKGRPRTLVILDDLEWLPGAEDFEESLGEVSDELQVSVLACIRSDESSDWQNRESGGFATITGPELLSAFTSALLAKYPRLAAAHPVLGHIARGAQGDLGWVLQLVNAAATGDEGSAYHDLLSSFSRRLARGPRQRKALSRLAALSLFGCPTPEWFLEVNADASQRRAAVVAMRDAGARQLTGSRWLLPSRFACEAILTEAAAGEEAQSRFIVERNTAIPVLANFVAQAAARPDEAFLDLVERLGRNADEVLAEVLNFEYCQEALSRWVRDSASPPDLATLIGAVGELLPMKLLESWTRHLAQLLTYAVRGTRPRPRDLARCFDVLRRYRAALERAEADAETSSWQGLIDTLDKRIVGFCVPATASVSARLKLMWSLWRLHEPKIDEALFDNAARFVLSAPDGNGRFKAGDYWAVLELDVLMGKMGASRDSLNTAMLLPLAHAPVSNADGIEVLLSRLMVRQFLGEENVDRGRLVERLRTEIPRSLAHSTLRQLSVAMSKFASFDRSLAVTVLNSCIQPHRLFPLAERASTAEVATFLGVAARVVNRLATDLLYTKDEPRTEFASMLAERIRLSGDGKGAGLLLNAAADIDSNYGRIREGFANCLAEALGAAFFEFQLLRDPRTTVLYYLLDGMIAAGVSFSEEIKERTIEVIANSIERSLQPRAPRLALLLAKRSDWGEMLAERLSQRLSAGRLLEGMTRARKVESLTYFHELGPYLYPGDPHGAAGSPGVAQLFVEGIKPHQEPLFFRLQQVERPEVLVRATQAVSSTVRRGARQGIATVAPGHFLLEALGGDWSRRLQRAGTAGDLAETLWGLRKLDSDVARRAVEGSRRTLERRVESALREPQLAIELLHVVERICPSAGTAILTSLRHLASWALAMEDLQYEQDPRLQGQAYLRLAELGYTPDPRKQEALYKKWESVVPIMSSPLALSSLLRMMASWDLEKARGLADRLQVTRVARRLREAARQDLQAAEGLIGALLAVGAQDQARALLRALGDVDRIAERLGLRGAATLVARLRSWDPGMGKRLSDSCVGLAQGQAQQLFVIDDSAHWLTLGWVAHRAQGFGELLDIPERPRSFELAKDVSVILWGAGWLARRPWVEDALAAAQRRQTGLPPPRNAWAAASVLSIVGRMHGLRWMIHDATASWHHALDASLYALEPLLETYRLDQDVQVLLREHLPRLRHRLQSRHLRTHPARPQVQKLLDEIAREE